MDTRLNIALVGFGRFGKKYFKSIKRNEKISLKAIYRKNNLYGSKFEELTHESLKKNKIEGAIICTPVNTHFKLSKFFIEKKIPIILEKPAAANIDEIKKLIKLSKKFKSSVIVNHSDLFNNNLKFLISKIKLLGKIKYIEADFGKYSNDYQDKNFLPHTDWLPHVLAIILKIVKKIKRIKILKNKIEFKKRVIFQNVEMSFNTDNKVEGKIRYTNKIKSNRRKLHIYGKKGYLMYDGYNDQNNFIRLKKKFLPKKSKSSPMENILEKLCEVIYKKRFYNDLELSFQIEKILEKFKKK